MLLMSMCEVAKVMHEPVEVTFYNVPTFLAEEPIKTIRARSMIIWQEFDDHINFILVEVTIKAIQIIHS